MIGVKRPYLDQWRLPVSTRRAKFGLAGHSGRDSRLKNETNKCQWYESGRIRESGNEKPDECNSYLELEPGELRDRVHGGVGQSQFGTRVPVHGGGHVRQTRRQDRTTLGL